MPPKKQAAAIAVAPAAARMAKKPPAKKPPPQPIAPPSPVKKKKVVLKRVVKRKVGDGHGGGLDEDGDGMFAADDDTAATPPPLPNDPAALLMRHLGNMHRALGLGIRSLCLAAAPSNANTETTLLCREQQVDMILRFLASDAHPTLQLFGMPGTGKTAAVKNAVGRFAKQRLGLNGSRMLVNDPSMVGAATSGGAPTVTSNGPKEVVSVVFFNGYVMQRPTDVFATLLRHLTRFRLGGNNGTGGQAAQQQALRIAPHQAAAQLEKRFSQGWGKGVRYEDLPLCVIVIDEMDKCCEHSGKTLFRLVDWLTMPYAKMKMITIANAMQLPERLDPKTRSRLNTTQRVTFPSYSPEQLHNILQQRLDMAHNDCKGLNPPCRVMSRAAEQYICRQIGLHNGDVRRLLQTSAAALQDVLCIVEDFREKVKSVTAISMDEVETALTGMGLPTMGDAKDGIAQVKHLSAVARNVLHDRFQDFLNSVDSPLLFTVILLIATETIKQAALQRSELGTAQLPIDRFFLLVRATIDAYVTMDANGTPPPMVSFTQFLLTLEDLRQVNYIELSVGDTDNTLRDATMATRISDTVNISIVHPPQDIIARCEGHALHERVGKSILRRHQGQN